MLPAWLQLVFCIFRPTTTMTSGKSLLVLTLSFAIMTVSVPWSAADSDESRESAESKENSKESQESAETTTAAEKTTTTPVETITNSPDSCQQQCGAESSPTCCFTARTFQSKCSAQKAFCELTKLGYKPVMRDGPCYT